MFIIFTFNLYRSSSTLNYQKCLITLSRGNTNSKLTDEVNELNLHINKFITSFGQKSIKVPTSHMFNEL